MIPFSCLNYDAVLQIGNTVRVSEAVARVLAMGVSKEYTVLLFCP
jgi:hypothetical protein